MAVAEPTFDLEAERAQVKLIRSTAEEGEAPAKPEDYLIIDDKYRLVRPYHFDFICSVKQRHAGRNIIDIFSNEFPALTREYYLHAVAIGLLRIDGTDLADPTATLSAGTRIRHLVHRHEPPVAIHPLEIIGTTPDLIAVNKPPTMPVHVSGQYRKNTVLSLLGVLHPDLCPLFPVHRLDKPVSGVLMFARSAAAADALRVGIANKGNVEKLYVARVMGAFPAAGRDGGVIVEANVALAWDPVNNGASAVETLGQQIAAAAAAAAAADAGAGGGSAGGGGEGEAAGEKEGGEGEGDVSGRKRRRKIPKADRVATYSAAMEQASKTRSCTVPRPAVTQFRLLGVAPDGKTSVVECRPLTGRTHQIRAHLAWLGHPIANDGQYGGTYSGPTNVRALAEELGVAWNNGGASGLVPRERVAVPGDDGTAAGGEKSAPNQTGNGSKREGKGDALMTNPSVEGVCPEFETPAELHDPWCPQCPRYGPKNYPTDLRPLWLHARRYACADWGFDAPLPGWAGTEWVPPLPAPRPQQE